MKKFLKICLIVLVVLIALAVILPFVVPLNHLKKPVVDWVNKTYGRQLVIDDIDLKLFGGLGATIGGVSLSEDTQFGKGSFFSVGKVHVSVKLFSLLGKTKIIKKILIDKPSITLIRAKNGAFNFKTLIQTKPEEEAEKPTPAEVKKTEKKSGPPSVIVEKIVLRDASVAFIDRMGEKEAKYAIENVNLSVEDITTDLSERLNIQFDMLLTGDASGKFTMEGGLGPIPSDQDFTKLPVKLNMDLDLDTQTLPSVVEEALPLKVTVLNGLALKVGLNGSLSKGLDITAKMKTGGIVLGEGKSSSGASGRFGVDLKVKGNILHPEALVLDGKVKADDLFLCLNGDNPMNCRLDLTALFKGAVQGGGEELVIESMSLTAGESDLDISARIVNFLSKPDITFSLSSKQLIVDALIAGAENLQSAMGSQEKKAEEAVSTEAVQAGGGSSLAALSLEGKINLKKVAYGKNKLENMKLQIELKNGLLTVSDLYADLYKGSLDGSLSYDMAKDVPPYSTKLAIKNIDLHEILTTNDLSDTVFGTLQANIDMTGAGIQKDVAVQNLKGTGSINLTDGKMVGGDSPKDTIIKKIQGNPALSLLLPGIKNMKTEEKKPEEKETKFKDVICELKAENGVATLSKCSMGSEDVDIDAAGNIRLTDLVCDLKGKAILSNELTLMIAGSKEKLEELPLPLTDKGELILPVVVGGQIPNLKFLPDIGELVKMATQGQLKGKLGDLLGGKNKGDGTGKGKGDKLSGIQSLIPGGQSGSGDSSSAAPLMDMLGGGSSKGSTSSQAAPAGSQPQKKKSTGLPFGFGNKEEGKKKLFPF